MRRSLRNDEERKDEASRRLGTPAEREIRPSWKPCLESGMDCAAGEKNIPRTRGDKGALAKKTKRTKWKKFDLTQQMEVRDLRMLGTVIPEGVNMVGLTAEDWEEIDMSVDSGATETVMNEDMLPSVTVEEGEACRKGVQYEIANGTLISNMGEKKFIAVGEWGEMRRVTAQVCDVNKPLPSVSKRIRAGNRVVFDEEGS